jgi:rsbT co-antagonist protein RsbR
MYQPSRISHRVSSIKHHISKERYMPSTLINLLNEQKFQLADALLKISASTRVEGQSLEDHRAALLASLDGIIAMLQQPPVLLEQMLQDLARNQLDNANDSGDALVGLEAERDAIYEVIQQAYPDATDALETLAELERLTRQRQRAILSLAYEQIVERLQKFADDQVVLRAAVQELSTPIVPVYSGVLVLPLVGRIDAARAQRITEALLEAIAREQADLVIIDVTGIATIDTSVANHLLQTARAANLLGSRVVLVGISAEVAQTLVVLGVDLGGLITLSDLQSGIEYALAQQGLAIMRRR